MHPYAAEKKLSMRMRFHERLVVFLSQGLPSVDNLVEETKKSTALTSSNMLASFSGTVDQEGLRQVVMTLRHCASLQDDFDYMSDCWHMLFIVLDQLFRRLIHLLPFWRYRARLKKLLTRSVFNRKFKPKISFLEYVMFAYLKHCNFNLNRKIRN